MRDPILNFGKALRACADLLFVDRLKVKIDPMLDAGSMGLTEFGPDESKLIIGAI